MINSPDGQYLVIIEGLEALLQIFHHMGYRIASKINSKMKGMK